MSQPDLIRELHAAGPVAPAELRERVRLVAAQAAPPRKRFTWGRASLVLVPAVAAAVAAAVFLPGGNHPKNLREGVPSSALQRSAHGSAAIFGLLPSSASGALQSNSIVPAPNAHRLQNYSTSLELRVRDAVAISAADKRAVAIATALGGYSQSLNVDASGTTGSADIVLRIPINHVQLAVRRLSALGTIIGENVSTQDLTANVNATDRLIARLQRQLADLRALPVDTHTQHQIDALTARIQRLQRGRAATLRSAHYATVHLQLTTRTPPPVKHHGHGPLHGIGVAFRWIGIGAVYTLAFGAPLLALAVLAWLAIRAVRRRREEALLSRP